MEFKPGTVVDRFEVVRHLGDGSRARVLLVRNRALHSLHALKLLHAPDRDTYRRFVQEGREQTRIRHPNVVAVTDVVELEGRVGLVMEYVDGISLHAALSDGEAVAREDALRLFTQICEGVIAAHSAGVLHRDLNPASVLLALNGEHADAKIADFGIAKGSGRDGPTLTGAAQTMGTPGYMAPEEIIDPATVDARADVFSLGAILYELLSGFPVFRKGDDVQSLAATLNGRHLTLRERAPGFPASIEAVIERALAADPTLRHGSVRALHDAVHACAAEVLAAPTRAAVGVQVAPVRVPTPAPRPAVPPTLITIRPPRCPCTPRRQPNG